MNEGFHLLAEVESSLESSVSSLGLGALVELLLLLQLGVQLRSLLLVLYHRRTQWLLLLLLLLKDPIFLGIGDRDDSLPSDVFL